MGGCLRFLAQAVSIIVLAWVLLFLVTCSVAVLTGNLS